MRFKCIEANETKNCKQKFYSFHTLVTIYGEYEWVHHTISNNHLRYYAAPKFSVWQLSPQVERILHKYFFVDLSRGAQIFASIFDFAEEFSCVMQKRWRFVKEKRDLHFIQMIELLMFKSNTSAIVIQIDRWFWRQIAALQRHTIQNQRPNQLNVGQSEMLIETGNLHENSQNWRITRAWVMIIQACTTKIIGGWNGSFDFSAGKMQVFLFAFFVRLAKSVLCAFISQAHKNQTETYS